MALQRLQAGEHNTWLCQGLARAVFAGQLIQELLVATRDSGGSPWHSLEALLGLGILI
jgi:hypothetical protein